jgi:hypothetical protein
MRSDEPTVVRRLRAARDVKDLIRTSNLLWHRSKAAQRAASSASARLNDVLRRSVEVCGK